MGEEGENLGATGTTGAYRDTRLISIGGGADEVMLYIICKIDGSLPSKKKGKG